MVEHQERPNNVVTLPRFDCQQDRDGTWYVHDRETGKVARFRGRALENLDIQDADELADSMNGLAEHGYLPRRVLDTAR